MTQPRPADPNQPNSTQTSQYWSLSPNSDDLLQFSRQGQHCQQIAARIITTYRSTLQAPASPIRVQVPWCRHIDSKFRFDISLAVSEGTRTCKYHIRALRPILYLISDELA